MTGDTIYYILFDIACLIIAVISTIRLKKRFGNDFVRFQPMWNKTKNSTIMLVVSMLLLNSVFLMITYMDKEFIWSEAILIGTSLLLLNGLFAWNAAYMFIGEGGIGIPMGWKAGKNSMKSIVSPNDIGQDIFSYKVIFNTDRKLLKIDIMRTRTAEFEKVLKKYDFPIE